MALRYIQLLIQLGVPDLCRGNRFRLDSGEGNDMTTQAGYENSLNLLLRHSLMSDLEGQSFSTPPLPDGIHFFRGALLAIFACFPVWILVFWAIAVISE